MAPLVTATDAGLFCEIAGVFIDPWQPVERAILTHAHTDHAHGGCTEYLTCARGEGPLRLRLGPDALIRTLPYGQSMNVNGVSVSFHPAGHILGSSQIRLEYQGEVWVISGDYKLQGDPTCDPFELIKCHTFITESTFGLPIYRWPDQTHIINEMNQWWRHNRARGWTSIVFAYALGKAQRVLAALNRSMGPIGVHGAIHRFLPAYQAAGIDLPEVMSARPELLKELKGSALIVAPASAIGSRWMQKFAPFSTAFASGLMQVRGARRWRSIDRGFVLSDHADWNGLLDTIAATGAQRIGVTHGYSDPLVRWLREQGREAWTITTRYGEDEGRTLTQKADVNPDDEVFLL